MSSFLKLLSTCLFSCSFFFAISTFSTAYLLRVCSLLLFRFLLPSIRSFQTTALLPSSTARLQPLHPHGNVVRPKEYLDYDLTDDDNDVGQTSTIRAHPLPLPDFAVLLKRDSFTVFYFRSGFASAGRVGADLNCSTNPVLGLIDSKQSLRRIHRFRRQQTLASLPPFTEEPP
ncbi:unnamed protein product [Lactuca saligna]|uniref:Uncharacterized protein n=1 Tax=Lactuca saligna TaxID=75948 RepID=A0AA35YLQ4_LACSI|nr:unnamed protein product [Lactuca saligna]